MQYLGGKYRIAKYIEAEVLAHAGGRSEYVEPFVGGGATFSRCAPHFETSRCYDVVPDLILMWSAVRDGWLPPSDLGEGEYQALRHAPPSPLRAFAGFGCSFGGKWFGGYARAHRGAAPGNNYAAGAARSVGRKASAFRGAQEIGVQDYRELVVTEGCVVYADPPYAGTTGYGAAGAFDSDEFWRKAEEWTGLGAAVLVSELIAPTGWRRVWSKAGPDYLGAQNRDARVESVFVHESIANRDSGK